jgi:hypothetical protein
MDVRNRRRLQAVMIVAIFVVPVIVALVLTSAGWTPEGRSYGQPIRPERDLASMPLRLADGRPYALRNHDQAWTLVALPGADCAEHCLRELDLVHRAQLGLGEHAANLRLLYVGVPPEGALAQGFDRVWTLATTPSHALDDLRTGTRDSVSAVLVTPDGKALTRYAAKFDPAQLRQDLEQAIR